MEKSKAAIYKTARLFTKQRGALQFEFHQHLTNSHCLHWAFSIVVILDPTVPITGSASSDYILG